MIPSRRDKILFLASRGGARRTWRHNLRRIAILPDRAQTGGTTGGAERLSASTGLPSDAAERRAVTRGARLGAAEPFAARRGPPSGALEPHSVRRGGSSAAAERLVAPPGQRFGVVEPLSVQLGEWFGGAQRLSAPHGRRFHAVRRLSVALCGRRLARWRTMEREAHVTDTRGSHTACTCTR